MKINFVFEESIFSHSLINFLLQKDCRVYLPLQVYLYCYLDCEIYAFRFEKNLPIYQAFKTRTVEIRIFYRK